MTDEDFSTWDTTTNQEEMMKIPFPSQGSLQYSGFYNPFQLNFSLLLFATKAWAEKLALMRVLLVIPFRKILVYMAEYVYMHILQHCLLKERFIWKICPEVCEHCKSKRWKGRRRKRLYFSKSTNKVRFNSFQNYKHKRLKSNLFVLKCFKWTRLNKLLTHPIWPSVRWHLLPINTLIQTAENSKKQISIFTSWEL